MKKRLGIKLANLREAVDEQYVIDDYPLELLLPFRAFNQPDENGWRPLAFIHGHHNYQRLQGRGAIDVVLHHLDSGVMVVSPSLSSALRWRVIYPSDAILCTPSYCAVRELLSVRYEISPPEDDWLRAILEEETPWFVLCDGETVEGERD